MHKFKQIIFPTKKKIASAILFAVFSFLFLHFAFGIAIGAGHNIVFYISLPIGFPSLLFISEQAYSLEKIVQVSILLKFFAYSLLQFLYSYLLICIFDTFYRRFV